MDDDNDARKLLRLVLEACHVDVYDSESAADALNVLDGAQFDLLISDIGMPLCDGYSLIGAVRARHQNAGIPAVALTAFVRPEDREHALLAGFDLHFGKPFDSTALIQALVALTGSAMHPR